MFACIVRTAKLVTIVERLIYILIFFVAFPQVDGVWAVAPLLPPDPLADANDEYVNLQRRPREEEIASIQTPALVGHRLLIADFSTDRNPVQTEQNPVTGYTPSPLCILMSLQI